MKKDTHTLIVGAGPSGLMLACQLIKYQVPFIIIDCKKTISDWVKASMVSTYSLEIFSELGLLDRIMALGHKVIGSDVYYGENEPIHFSYYAIQQNSPVNLHIDQPIVEKILYGYLLEHKQDVLWENTLIAFSQHDNGIVATIQAKNTTKKISAEYIIGADGASSFIRKTSKIEFVGTTYPHYFLLGNAKLKWEKENNVERLFLTSDGFLSVYPLANNRLHIGGNITHNHIQKNPQPEELKKLFQDRCHIPGEIYDVTQLSYYKTHCRYVNNRIINRAILIGDAAHILSGLTGLGMNIGLQDAYNLGWKLAFLYQHIASEKILMSYEEEQQFVFKKTMSLSNILEAAYIADTTPTKRLRAFMIQNCIHDETIRKREIMRLMQIDLHYQGCSTFQNNVEKQVGFRSPNPIIFNENTNTEISFLDSLNNKKYMLLCFSGIKDANHTALSKLNTIASHSELTKWMSFYFIRAHTALCSFSSWQHIEDKNKTIHTAFSVDAPTLCLIRPDRYITYFSACCNKKDLTQFLLDLDMEQH